MCKRRGRIYLAALYPFLYEGVIARQLLELAHSIEVGAAIAQVGDMSDRHRCRRDRQGDEGRAHPLQGRFRQNEVMDSPVGANHEVCHKLRGTARVLAEPGRSFPRPL